MTIWSVQLSKKSKTSREFPQINRDWSLQADNSKITLPWQITRSRTSPLCISSSGSEADNNPNPCTRKDFNRLIKPSNTPRQHMQGWKTPNSLLDSFPKAYSGPILPITSPQITTLRNHSSLKPSSISPNQLSLPWRAVSCPNSPNHNMNWVITVITI